MQPDTHLGMNRTGARMSPIDVGKMQELAELAPVSDAPLSLGLMRSEAVAEAEAVGSVPMPGTFKGVIETGMAMLLGDHPEVLIDKLGERLAFERTGARLYEALITKCEQLLQDPGHPLLAALRRIRAEEVEHFHMLAAAIESLGADPTAQTPGADVQAVMASGILQVVTDPRTTIAQSLNAMLVAELADNASWELLIKLVRQGGYAEIGMTFEQALQQEAAHLAIMKQAVSEAVMAEAGA